MLTDGVNRVRTLTGKEIELDIEPDYKVRLSRIHPAIVENTPPFASHIRHSSPTMLLAQKIVLQR